MKQIFATTLTLAAALFLFASSVQASIEEDKVTKLRVENTLANLPLRFEKNEGQTSDEVKFLSRGQGYTMFFTPTEAVTVLRRVIEDQVSVKAETSIVRMEIVGANQEAIIKGQDKLPGTSNYFKGNDKSKWRQGIENFQKIHYEEVYPGIDLVYYGNQKKLEYDFVVKPGADPQKIQLNFKGTKELSIDNKGNLILETKTGKVVQRAPIIYQNIGGEKKSIEGRYVIKDNHNVAFKLAQYNPDHNLVIDPVLGFSTYLGGGGVDVAKGIAVDDEGSIFVTGDTFSTDFDIFNEIEGDGDGIFSDVFVFKIAITPNGPGLAYSTYLGGSERDFGNDIALDSEGNVYVVGSSWSGDFNTLNPIEGDSPAEDVIVFKLEHTGNVPSLAFSTYLGGSQVDIGNSIAVDTTGGVYVAGLTSSTDFDILGQIEGDSGGTDAIVFKLLQRANIPVLAWSTYLGGADTDSAKGIAVDDLGNAYVVGSTRSTDFDTLIPIEIDQDGPPEDIFVSKIRTVGGIATLGWSTYLGGSGDDNSSAIAVDGDGNVYIAGTTFSTDFNMVNSIEGDSVGGDAIVAKIREDDNTLFLDWSTYLGGNGLDSTNDIAVDSSGNVYVTGETSSVDFDLLDEVEGNQPGTFDVIAFQLKQAGNVPSLGYSTYLGGNQNDFGNAIVVDNSGRAYVSGATNSTDFDVKDEIEQDSGNTDVLVFRLDPTGDTTPPVITVPADVNAEATGPLSSPAIGTATATDDVSAPGDIIITNDAPVAGFPLGLTVVTWTAEDEAGNTATDTQNVTVVDTTPPTIEITGDNPFFLEVGTPFVDPWAVAGDLVDGPITLSAISGPGDSPEQIKVTYSATDSSGNTATAVRIIVIVADLTPPVITILGDNPAFIQAGDPYVDAGATAIDAQDGVLPVTTVSNEVNPGEFAITYTATDSSGNSESAVRTLFVVADLTPPVITIHGFNPTTAEVGEPYVDLGATAVDNVDGELPLTIVTELGDIEGTFDVIYTATDSSGNSSTATRHVIPTDTTPPVITILGDNPQTVQQGDPYVDPGATATDNADGPPIPVTSTLQPGAAPGTFEVVYSASDSSGNNATATRVVIVTPAPEED